MTEKAKKSRMGETAVNFGILQSTAPGAAGAEPPPQGKAEPALEQPAAPKGDKAAKAAHVPKQTAPAKGEGKKQAPATPRVKPSDASKAKGAGPGNPFGYAVGPTWPLVGYEKPFLVPISEDQGRAAAALSVRIPLDLNRTVELHCAKLGVKNLSEWVREAMARQLALEQQHLSKK